MGNDVSLVEFKNVRYDKSGNIARITLNAPEKLNVWQFKGGMTDDFFAALNIAVEDDDVKAVIIKGAGRGFSAGHDLSEVGFVYGFGKGQPGERRPSQRVRLDLDRKIWFDDKLRIFLCPKITIAQIHGYCLEEGLQVAEACDFLVAAEDAQLGHVGQRLVFAGATGILANLTYRVGLTRAVDLLLTGRTISGTEAAAMGLVTKAVPAAELEAETEKLAESIALLPRDGIAIGKTIRHQIYERLGITSGYAIHYLAHTMSTNVRWEEDEYNFFKERRSKGVKAAFGGRDKRYEGLVENPRTSEEST